MSKDEALHVETIMVSYMTVLRWVNKFKSRQDMPKDDQKCGYHPTAASEKFI